MVRLHRRPNGEGGDLRKDAFLCASWLVIPAGALGWASQGQFPAISLFSKFLILSRYGPSCSTWSQLNEQQKQRFQQNTSAW